MRVRKVSFPAAEEAEAASRPQSVGPAVPGRKISFPLDEEAQSCVEKKAPGTAPQGRKKFTRAWSRLASGHAAKGADQAMFVPPTRPGDQPTELHKELNQYELEIYHKLNDDAKEQDAVLPFMPAFRGVTEDDNGKHWVVMGNLLYGFGHAKVMDVKLGVRTFLETEAEGKKARNDLYKKFLKLYPEQLTEDERAAEAVTKYRYMSIHDEMSTSSQYGFRIDGIAGYATRRPTELREEARKFSTLEEARGALRTFATAAAKGVDAEPEEGACSTKRKVLSLVLEHGSTRDLPSETPLATSEALLEQLRRMRAALEASEFLRSHECLGTSVLLVADEKGRGGAFWIDFAKTRPLPEGLAVDHRSPWQLGNHEDGILLGLDRLIEVWEGLVVEFQAEADEEYEELINARASVASCLSAISTDSRTEQEEVAD